MKKRTYGWVSRVIAMVLCLAMLLPMIEGAGTASVASAGEFTILAASDFQSYGSSYQEANAIASANLSALLDTVTSVHSIDALFLCGDYSSVSEDGDTDRDDRL